MPVVADSSSIGINSTSDAFYDLPTLFLIL
jgi:hypothetical protein